MIKEDFDILAENMLNDCYDLLLRKEEEYSDKDDRLSAFKLNWLNENKLNPNEVLWGMMVKHLNSIYTMIKNNNTNLMQWYEKLTDSVCYLCLLWGLLNEHKL